MNTGNLIIRIAFGLLFVWVGVEKFVETFLGGMGIQSMADFQKACGLACLGDTGIYIAGALLAALELIANILVEHDDSFSTYNQASQVGH